MSKKQPKLTPWFRGNEIPARDGVYEVFWGYFPVYARFHRGSWRIGTGDAEAASGVTAKARLPVRWRGLAVKP